MTHDVAVLALWTLLAWVGLSVLVAAGCSLLLVGARTSAAALPVRPEQEPLDEVPVTPAQRRPADDLVLD